MPEFHGDAVRGGFMLAVLQRANSSRWFGYTASSLDKCVDLSQLVPSRGSRSFPMISEGGSAYVIANPRAGRARHKKPMERRPCESERIWAETEGEGHAESLAYEASMRGFHWIIAMGGDGTIHEVLNGMMRNANNRSILGVIPAGTANDYAASFQVTPTDARAGALRVDVGRLSWRTGSRYFANVAGLGFSGDIANRARRMLRIPARVRYTLALLRQLGPGYAPKPMSVSLDGGPMIESKTLLVSAALGQREGSYPLHARADLTDGLFEFLQLGRLSRRELAWHFPAMLRGVLPRNHSQVFRRQCRHIRIEAKQPIPVHLDGEFPKGAVEQELTEIDLEVIPGAIEVEML